MFFNRWCVMSRAPLHREVSAEPLLNGGWLLAVMHDGRRIASRYFGYSLREAKAHFIMDIKAGLI